MCNFFVCPNPMTFLYGRPSGKSTIAVTNVRPFLVASPPAFEQEAEAVHMGWDTYFMEVAQHTADIIVKKYKASWIRTLLNKIIKKSRCRSSGRGLALYLDFRRTANVMKRILHCVTTFPFDRIENFYVRFSLFIIFSSHMSGWLSRLLVQLVWSN